MVLWDTSSFGYGQFDRTSHRDVFSQKLETEHTRYTTWEVREEFSNKHGMYNISENMDEIKKHEEYGCNDLSLEEADGNLSSGHIHEKAIEQIKSYDSNIADVFTDEEIEVRLRKKIEEFPNDTFEEIVDRTKRDLSEDASRIHTR